MPRDFFEFVAPIRRRSGVAVFVSVLLFFYSGLSASQEVSPFSSPVGVNYGRSLASNPLPPARAMAQIKRHFGMVKLFRFEPEVMEAALANQLDIVLGTLNDKAAAFAAGDSEHCSACDAYVQLIRPYASRIKAIVLSNEPFMTAGDGKVDPNLLVPAMKNLEAALARAGLPIAVTTAISFAVMTDTYPTGNARFRPDIQETLRQLLAHLASPEASGFVLVNLYPFFALQADPVNVPLPYALFRRPGPVHENLLAAQQAAFNVAVAKLKLNSPLTVYIGETGWPSAGSALELPAEREGMDECQERRLTTVCHQRLYTQGLIRWLRARPNPTPVFLFEMYDENLKPGADFEPYFGLFTQAGQPKFEIPAVAVDK